MSVNTPIDESNLQTEEEELGVRELRDTVASVLFKVEQIEDKLDETVPRLLDVQQVANRLNISERSVRSLISDDTIPSTKIRRRRLVPREALEAFIERKLDESGLG